MKPEKISQEDKDNLLRIIRAKRSDIVTYLSKAEPTANRLTTFTTAFSAIAAVSTGILTKVLGTEGKTSPSWFWLSLGATACSALAGLTTQIVRSRDLVARISKAQAADTKLEALETLIQVGQIQLKEAVARYEKCVLEVPFVTTPSRRALSFRSIAASFGWMGRVALELVKGDINTPASGQFVGDTFLCSGTATDLQEGVHLWLAVEASPPDGRIWPKEAEVKVTDGMWARTLFEEGTLEKFAVSLFAANPKGHRYIENWLSSCIKNGGYPELRRTPGMIRLARVTGLSRNLPPTAAAPGSPERAEIEESGPRAE